MKENSGGMKAKEANGLGALVEFSPCMTWLFKIRSTIHIILDHIINITCTRGVLKIFIGGQRDTFTRTL